MSSSSGKASQKLSKWPPKAELEERLKEFEANPEAGYSWEQVKSHLRNGT
ncbi:MAG: addiction module protein [Pseudomonadota bacterium]|nr:addiction module protein [Pseudomonadota bacterium]